MNRINRAILAWRIRRSETLAKRMRCDIEGTPPQLRGMVCSDTPAKLRTLDRELEIMRCQLAQMEPQPEGRTTT